MDTNSVIGLIGLAITLISGVIYAVIAIGNKLSDLKNSFESKIKDLNDKSEIRHEKLQEKIAIMNDTMNKYQEDIAIIENDIIHLRKEIESIKK